MHLFTFRHHTYAQCAGLWSSPKIRMPCLKQGRTFWSEILIEKTIWNLVHIACICIFCTWSRKTIQVAKTGNGGSPAHWECQSILNQSRFVWWMWSFRNARSRRHEKEKCDIVRRCAGSWETVLQDKKNGATSPGRGGTSAMERLEQTPTRAQQALSLPVSGTQEIVLFR